MAHNDVHVTSASASGDILIHSLRTSQQVCVRACVSVCVSVAVCVSAWLSAWVCCPQRSWCLCARAHVCARTHVCAHTHALGVVVGLVFIRPRSLHVSSHERECRTDASPIYAGLHAHHALAQVTAMRASGGSAVRDLCYSPIRASPPTGVPAPLESSFVPLKGARSYRLLRAPYRLLRVPVPLAAISGASSAYCA